MCVCKISLLSGFALCFLFIAAANTNAKAQSSTAASQTAAQRPAAQASPTSGTSSSASSATALTIELYSVKVRFENDGTGVRQIDVRVKANTADGATELKTLSFDYNALNEKASLAFLRVTKPNGSVVNAKPDALADAPAPVAKDAPAFAELREAHVTVPAMSPGDTLSYETMISTVKPAAPGEFWFAHSFLTSRTAVDEELEINVPAERHIYIKTSPQFSPKISTAGVRKIYFWSRLNAAPVEDQESEANKPTKTPDVVLTSFANWDAVAKWLGGMEHSAETPTDDVTKKLADLTADQKTDADKIEAIYDFVAKQIRTIRIPPEQTASQIHDAANVLQAGYGDESDKCALLAALLNAAKFPTSIALLPAKDKFDPELPWPGGIEHEVVTVTAGKDTFWLDPAEATIPFGMLLRTSRGKEALIASSGVAAHFAKTPLDPPFPSTQTVEITGRVTSLGKLTARVRYTLRGDNEVALRTAFAHTPQEQWNSVAQTMATLDGFHGTVTDANPSNPTDTREPFTLDFVLTSPDFLDWSQARVLLALPLPAFGLPDAPADSSKPIELGSPLTVTTKLTLDLPVNDSAHVPAGAGAKRAYADYESTYAAEEHSLTAQRTLKFTSRELPADSRGDYQEFALAVQADEGQGVVVDNLIPGVPAEATAPQLMQAGAAEIQDRHFANALLLFEQVAEINPQEPNLWLSTGTAQLELGKYSQAEASLQKQLAANPKDESANTLLGVAFYDQQKYDAAEAAFKNQLALKPLDSSAYLYLGAVYIDEKHFDNARAQLEKASVLSPDNAGIYVRLGQADLGLEKNDEALADFGKAAALSPSPLIDNDIAYALAEKSVALDRAKEYADAAIKPTEKILSQIDLQHVTPNDLVAMNALPAFWDTLGWIYFQQGKSALAEPLIEAAWRLNQTGDTGNHLAQLYEARGEKQSAIRLYEQALAAGTASNETRERLKKLLGPAAASNASIDASVKRAAGELARERTVSLGAATVSGKAEFVVLLEPSVRGAVASDARFLLGDDRLAAMSQRFHTASFPPILPPGTRARMVLRGQVTCSTKTAKCEFVFDPPHNLTAEQQ
jgi:tetratricopeptide (TPR) repeat protein